MNKWVSQSIEIANSRGYLDKLHEVYPVDQESWRGISVEIKTELEKAYKSGDNVSLIKQLLKLPKFPIDDPYVAFLRKNDIFLEYNPITVNLIANRVRALGFKAVIEAIEEPKAISRRISTFFGKWIVDIGYPLLSESQFEKYDEGIAFLRGKDKQLKDFANRKLKCTLGKGLDFIVKVKGKYIIGEAKFLTDYGGGQNANFESALKMLKGKQGIANRIAIFDGVVWIRGNNKMHKAVCKLKEPVLSALLLKDFLRSAEVYP